MNTETHQQTLKTISHIFSAAKGKQLGSGNLIKLEKELKFLSNRLDISIEEAYLFSIIFTQNMENESADYSSLGKYLKCNVIDIMARSAIFDSLKNKNLIVEKKIRGRLKKRHLEYLISDSVQDAVLYDKFPIEKEETKINSAIEVLEKIHELTEEYEDEDTSIFELFMQINELLDEFEDFSLIKKIKNYGLNDYDKTIFLYSLWSTLIGTESLSMSRTVETFIKSSSRRIKYSQKLISGDNELIKKRLIELEKASFFNDSGFKLTDKAVRLLEDEGIKLAEIDQKDVMDHTEIKVKSLFYNAEETRSLSTLAKTFQAERFQKVQETLKEKSLPIGMNCIFYGPPGTGKTESVLQLAKETKRDIFRVDISETKSKWFGDSEKLIKKIFTRYQNLYHTKELAPILLFNEADAILSKRTGVSDSGVDQTRNAIQNILLEELENFKGIFIATTNLIDNLDTAFERRFLFKVEIKLPNESARQRIWESKLEFLSPEHCLQLARKFNFSGGEIENITRKILIHEIINSQKIDFGTILEFCKIEKFEKDNSGTIGFKI